MLIEPKELQRLTLLVRDIRSGVLPAEIAGAAVAAFFCENPHLLMVERFDEHMQTSLDSNEADIILKNILADRVQQYMIEDLFEGGADRLDLPLLEFRTPTGRWAGLIDVPVRHDAFVFSYSARRVLRAPSSLPDSVLYELLSSQTFEIPFDAIVTDLQERIHRPREPQSRLWSPKLWTPNEQLRQRQLLDASLNPHFERWKSSGICLDDLNPSEFEDLVGQVLFAAGLKVHKVRETPQGGRDLIARGILIPSEEPIEMAVEVKHRRTVDRPEVQLALYQNRDYPALLFVTSGRFTAGVFREKTLHENRYRLFLKDGLAVGDMIRTHFKLK